MKYWMVYVCEYCGNTTSNLQTEKDPSQVIYCPTKNCGCRMMPTVKLAKREYGDGLEDREEDMNKNINKGRM